MHEHPLDNPLWSSLSTMHRDWAVGNGDPLRYPPEMAPFLAARAPMRADALERLLPPGETVFLIGPRPEAPRGFVVEDLGELHQMILDARLEEAAGAPIVPLTSEAHRAAVLELTARVYPHYFRPRTMELGRYFGIFDGGTLAAMIGERMGMPGFRELSAVCTHPDLTGRGLARRLMAYLVNDLLARGQQPFLHVSPGNQRARALYQRLGFRTRTMIRFSSLTRR